MPAFQASDESSILSTRTKVKTGPRDRFLLCYTVNMNPSRFFRIVLTVLLVIAAIFGSIGLVWAAPTILSTGELLMVGIASVATMVFSLIISRDLLKNRLIAGSTFSITVVVATICALFVALFGTALAYDALGLYCPGLTSSPTSCTIMPMIIVVLVVTQPVILAVASILLAFGTYKQLKTH
jgi:hypothetical protein